jgi:hypothetical protein
MDRRHDWVRRRSQEAMDEMRSWDRFGLSAPIALELGPDARRTRTGVGPR